MDGNFKRKGRLEICKHDQIHEIFICLKPHEDHSLVYGSLNRVGDESKRSTVTVSCIYAPDNGVSGRILRDVESVKRLCEDGEIVVHVSDRQGHRNARCFKWSCSFFGNHLEKKSKICCFVYWFSFASA